MPSSLKRAAINIFLLASSLTTSLIAQSSINQTSAAREISDSSFDDAINHGNAAFNDGHYEAAVQHFKTAIACDPASAKARLYLGHRQCLSGRSQPRHTRKPRQREQRH